MKRSLLNVFIGLLSVGIFIPYHSVLAQVTENVSISNIVDVVEVERILNTLASDEMEGRASFSPGIEKAAQFISDEYRKIGLEEFGTTDYRQTFYVSRISPGQSKVTLNGQNIPSDQFIVSSTNPSVTWDQDAQVEILEIKEGEEFATRYRAITTSGKDALVLVDPSFSSLFSRYKGFTSRSRVSQTAPDESALAPSTVFILSDSTPQTFQVSFTNVIEDLPLANMVGMIPGRSKPDEYVIFSAHYDHIGILPAVGQDSIANGADDDASGVSAVISLAHYYKTRNDNERTLLFVAFTAEEIGLIGSKYFSSQLDPDQVTAMINIEMIGKDSRFGPNALYVTGFDQSNLATIMQENVRNTVFEFHPDPYPTQNLFYRSDNATLAAAGVPAHSFSTVQIEKDQYYHTVGDEVSTLNIENIVSSIKAIAIGAQSIVAGKDTPNRVAKLER